MEEEAVWWFLARALGWPGPETLRNDLRSLDALAGEDLDFPLVAPSRHARDRAMVDVSKRFGPRSLGLAPGIAGLVRPDDLLDLLAASLCAGGPTLPFGLHARSPSDLSARDAGDLLFWFRGRGEADVAPGTMPYLLGMGRTFFVLALGPEEIGPVAALTDQADPRTDGSVHLVHARVDDAGLVLAEDDPRVLSTLRWVDGMDFFSGRCVLVYSERTAARLSRELAGMGLPPRHPTVAMRAAACEMEAGWKPSLLQAATEGFAMVKPPRRGACPVTWAIGAALHLYATLCTYAGAFDTPDRTVSG